MLTPILATLLGLSGQPAGDSNIFGADPPRPAIEAIAGSASCPGLRAAIEIARPAGKSSRVTRAAINGRPVPRADLARIDAVIAAREVTAIEWLQCPAPGQGGTALRLQLDFRVTAPQPRREFLLIDLTPNRHATIVR